ncbi:MAG: WG repeat-containing protein [Armatimonadota bacterium]
MKRISIVLVPLVLLMLSSFVQAKILAVACQGEKAGFVDSSGKFVIPSQFEDAYPFTEDLAAVKIKGKWGFINPGGKIVIEPTFDDVKPFQCGMAYVVKADERGVIDNQGKLLTASSNIYLGKYYSQDMLLASAKDQFGWMHYGFLNTSFDVGIEFQYDLALPFSDELAAVKVGGKWGYIDKNNKMVIPAVFDVATRFSGGVAAVLQNGKCKYINKQGKVILAVPQVQGVYDLVTVSGEEFFADEFSCGCARVCTDRDGWRYGFINGKGNLIFDGIRYGDRFSEGLASFCTDDTQGKYGYIDTNGKVVIKPRFEEAEQFHNGLAKVKVGGKYGFINKTGAIVIKPQFDGARYFQQVSGNSN